MANFLTFEENQVLINDNLFPANGVSLQLNADTVPVKDIYGNLLYYSPTGPIKGSLNLSFFLTGVLPSYFRVENQDETPIKIAFNNIVIPDCYLTNLSFSVKPFEPIPVRAELVFYHGIRALNTDPLILNNQTTNIPANGIAFSNNKFTSSLNTLMGTASYILTSNRSSFSENPADFVVTDFDYQFSVERVPILKVNDIFPLRVAMKEATAEFTVTSNNLDGYLDIHGNTAEFSAVLRDTTQLGVYDIIDVTGIIVDQSYEISDENYGVSKIKMMQSFNRQRSPITIPMEVSNPNIVVPPTVNPVSPIIIPGSAVISKPVIEDQKPKQDDPQIGTTTTMPPDPTPDFDTYFYYQLLFDMDIYRLGAGYKPIIYEKITKEPIIKNFTIQYNNKDYELKYETSVFPDFINTLSSVTNDNITQFQRKNTMGCVFKVNQNFINYFADSDFYNNNLSNIAFEFTFDTTDSQSTVSRSFLYSDLLSWVQGYPTPIGGDGSKDKPYKLYVGNVYFGSVGINQ